MKARIGEIKARTHDYEVKLPISNTAGLVCVENTVLDVFDEVESQQTPDIPGRRGMSYFGQVKTDVVTVAW